MRYRHSAHLTATPQYITKNINIIPYYHTESNQTDLLLILALAKDTNTPIFLPNTLAFL